MALSPRASFALAFLLVATACSGSNEIAGPTVRMDFERRGSFFDAPFPSLDLQDANGFFDLSAFPNRSATALLSTEFDLAEEDANGAGLSSPIHLRTTDPIDPASLPSMADSITTGASVFLVDVTSSSPGLGQRVPAYVAYVPDTLFYGTTQVLSIVPLQGAPLRPKTTYAAVVTTRVRDTTNRALVSSTAVRELAVGKTPRGLDARTTAAYRDALDVLATMGVPHAEVAGLAVFTTADPGFQIRAVVEHALANAPVISTPFAFVESFPDFCVFESQIAMPVYQDGVPPYLGDGGRWRFDPNGTPIPQATEAARVVVTLPRNQPVPASGFPPVVFVRTGAGGDRPLVDRGPQATNGGPAIAPGTGPALGFAHAGFAGVSVDGPHGGIRNVSGGDEQFLIFNVFNPMALRDNIRQSAIELVLLPHALSSVTIDGSACGLPSAIPFDLSKLAIMGHSMGATIAPVVVAHEPMYRAMLLSGAGASYIENVLYKQKPLPIREFFTDTVGYDTADLTRHDVALGIFQWANDSADPLSFLRGVVREPRASGAVHVLMMQGIVDHYIMPTIANATSLGLGLELAGPSLDSITPEIAEFTPLEQLMPLVGSATTTLPASGNLAGVGTSRVTAVVTQHREDGIEDGHEVVFQTAEPKHEYECFLSTFRTTGVPRVPAPGADPLCP